VREIAADTASDQEKDSPKTERRGIKKAVLKVSGGGGGGVGGVGGAAGGGQGMLREPNDYSGWPQRSCTGPKCINLDSDPVSFTHTNGAPCDGACKRSAAYSYCQANKLKYHKFPDGKFYDPEKK